MPAYYDEFENKYYNPDDNDKKPGQNENWKMIQKGFSKIGSTQLETTEGLTLGKGTDDEESLTASELKEIKNPSQLETTGGLTLGKGTAAEESLTAGELQTIKRNSLNSFVYAANNSNTLEIPAGGIAQTGEVDLRDLLSSHDLKGGHYKVIPFLLMGYDLIIVSAAITVDTPESGEISATNAFPNFDEATDAWAKVKLYNPTNSAITLNAQYFGFYIARSEQY